MSEQHQFLTVIDRDEAERRFLAALDLRPLAAELVPLAAALGRVLAEDVRSPVDVPSFDRSNVDGYAVQARDTFGSSEAQPRRLTLAGEEIAPGQVPRGAIGPGAALPIATGGMLPRGADAVVMVEHTDAFDSELVVRRAVTPGANVSFAGTDITAGELVLYAGIELDSRETGVLAAVGVAEVPVVRCPRVAVLSTGDELIAPGDSMRPSLVYDSNARILADAVRELGGEPVELGIVGDDLTVLRERLSFAIAECDAVLLSGGTSKGAGDLSYRVVGELREPGIVAHGVALKPGKPICLAATRGKPVVVLPGFPTSAIFTFHEFVAPVLCRLAGRDLQSRRQVAAELATRVNSEIGRTEYLLVSLLEGNATARDCDTAAKLQPQPRVVAWPMGKGSGSVTAFSRADGFVTIGRQEEIVEAGTTVNVTLLGPDMRPADLVVIGSHCVGLDFLLAEMERRGWRTKLLTVGSTAGLEAAKRGQCDLAGVHLLDPATGKYNAPFLTPDLVLIRGYGRMQGIALRLGDLRFAEKTRDAAVEVIRSDASCIMVNRNAGSGTRILIDQLLGGSTPSGYAVQPRNHNAVAAAIVQGRADWGVCIESAARRAGLAFLPVQEEQYDFVVPRSRLARPAILAFREVFSSPDSRIVLTELGFSLTSAVDTK